MDKTEIKSGQKTKGERKRRRSTTLNNALGIQGEIFFLKKSGMLSFKINSRTILQHLNLLTHLCMLF